VRRNGFARRAAGGILILATTLLAGLAGGASASTGGAALPGSGPPPPPTPTGAPSPAPSAGTLSLVSATTSPKKSFYFGFRSPRLTYTIGSTQAVNDLKIDVVNSLGEVVKTFYREDVAPNVPSSIRWDGTTAEGRPARNGEYSFRISSQTEVPAARNARAETTLSLNFSFYGYAFPILGQHEYSLGAGRFGAGRSGHTHEGQDTMAACGTPLVAARGGRVQFSGYQSLAGNYIVIDGKGTGYDFMYAHLAEPSPLLTGEVVRTGQPIGIVGDTGDASACHLHFEMWTTPGWYEGGSPIDPLPYLERWDRYS
jgi:murein DD-endopeptidase MepM/ murein hydrolase activator NlpD